MSHRVVDELGHEDNGGDDADDEDDEDEANDVHEVVLHPGELQGGGPGDDHGCELGGGDWDGNGVEEG